MRYFVKKNYYVNITVTTSNINKTRLMNMVIFRDFNFRDNVIKTNITIYLAESQILTINGKSEVFMLSNYYIV